MKTLELFSINKKYYYHLFNFIIIPCKVISSFFELNKMGNARNEITQLLNALHC